MTTKILIGGAELAALFAAHPDAELELTKQAASLVADQILRKIDRVPLIDELTKKLTADLRSTYSFPKAAAEIIETKATAAAKSAVDMMGKAALDDLIRTQLTQMVERWSDQMAKRLEGKIDAVILAKVNAVLKSAPGLAG